MTDNYDAIVFGCWNNKGCNNNDGTDLTKTMNKMNEYVDKYNNIKYLIVAGDNYYPVKEKKKDKSDVDSSEKKEKKKEKINEDPDKKDKKKKTFNEEVMMSGFECLLKKKDKLEKVYLLFGNHDLEDVFDNVTENNGYCKTINTEFKNYNNDPKINVFKNVCEQVCGNNLFVMLDTTMYEMTDKSDCLRCYDGLFGLDISNYNLDNPVLQLSANKMILDHIRVSQCTQVINILNAHIKKNSLINKRIIFVGHHPIATSYSKKKDDKYSEKRIHCTKLADMLMNVFTLLNLASSAVYGKKLYYLCADTHLYEKSKITISHYECADELVINQYISGTGGADKDDVVKKVGSVVFDYDDGNKSIYYDQHEQKSTNGFLLVSGSEPDDRKFIQFVETGQTGGKINVGNYSNYNKYKKYAA